MGENSALNGDEKMTQLPHEIYESTLQEVIKNNFGDEDYSIEYSAGSNKGDNYIGIVYRVEVKSKKNEEKKLQLIVKLPPQDLARREQFIARPTFLREVQFYDEIFPLYQKFQEEKGIDIETEGFHQAPFCYKTMIEEPYEGLYFEDLKHKKFEMFDRFAELTEDHVFLAMKAIAKMHAIFFCLNDQKPDLVAQYRDMQEIFLMKKDDMNMQGWFESLKGGAREAVKDCDGEINEKLEEFLKKNFLALMAECVSGADAEPYAILCHGDNQKPVDIRLLDFQLLRYASPICDLVYYIFSCTTKKLREKFYQEFLNVYHETLSSFIERLGSNSNKLYPREAFDEHLKRFGKFGLTMALMILPMIMSNASEVPDLDEMAHKMKEARDNNEEFDPKKIMDFTTMSTASACNQRMRDVIIDMVNLGYI